MNVRDAHDDDLPAVLDMARRFYVAAGEPEGAFDGLHTLTNVNALRANGALLVVEAPKGELVGMLGMLVVPGLCSPAPRVHEVCLWVEPGHRGSVALLRLLREFDRRATESGAMGAQLSALSSSPPALRKVYERMGYALADTSHQKRFDRRT
jgi:GNAT superfamily N-acetyltransferase